MDKKWVITGLILVIIAIILGAFGAHGLKKLTFDPVILDAFDTATKYQFFQGLGFLIIPFIADRFSFQSKGAFRLMLYGTIFFSGSIYGLTFAKIHDVSVLKKAFGPITPLGGLFMIAGWILVLISVIRSKKQ